MHKNQFILKAFAFTMAALLLISTTGVAMDMHYCGGEFQNFSLFSEAKSCHEVAMKHKACHTKKLATEVNQDEKLGEKKDNCCSNKSVFIQLDKDYIHDANIGLEEHSQKSLLSTIVSKKPVNNIHYVKFYKNYKPPLLDREIHIDIQSFLL